MCSKNNIEIYLLAFIFLIFAGCNVNDGTDTTPSQLSFDTLDSNYPLGATVQATFQNKSDEAVGINLCTTKLERQENDEWVPKGPEIFCQLSLKMLGSGQQESYQITLADSLNLSQGQYRLTTGVEVGNENRMVSTQTFEVSAAFEPL